MAELEKAIIDSVDKPKYVGGIEEVLRVMWRGYPRADKSKLVDYASRMKTSAVCQRLGFLLDFLAGKRLIEEIPERLKRRLLEGVGTATVYIGPRGFGGNYSRDWRVIKTISDEQLMSEISIK
jgi:predicted transcriptional regulator of viral defense system